MEDNNSVVEIFFEFVKFVKSVGHKNENIETALIKCFTN
jgi:hypothetical protein